MSFRNIKLPEFQFTAFRKKAYIISITLIVIGLISIIARGGLRYGIDFTGGIVLQVHFDKNIPIEQVRSTVIEAGYKNATIQKYGTANDYLITFQGDIDKEVDTIGPNIVGFSTYPNPTNGENSVAIKIKAYDDQTPIKNIFLKSSVYPEIQQVSAVDKYDNNEESGIFTLSVEGIKDTILSVYVFAVDYANNKGPEKEIQIDVCKEAKTNSTIIADWQDSLYAKTEKAETVFSPTAKLVKSLKEAFKESNIRIDREEVVGPSISKELQLRSLWVVLLGMLAILIYVWIRFTFRFGVAAVLALFHDVLITLGIFSLMNKEITIPIIAALLTLIGYSINDSIVVSDRIRENIKLLRRNKYSDIINISLNQTLTRTVITSLTTLLVLLSLYFFGGAVIHDFAFALIIGVIVGTYSSIFVVAPIVLDWEEKYPTKKVR